MKDLCEKCSGWIRGSATAGDHDPATWCTCPPALKQDMEEFFEEVL